MNFSFVTVLPMRCLRNNRTYFYTKVLTSSNTFAPSKLSMPLSVKPLKKLVNYQCLCYSVSSKFKERDFTINNNLFRVNGAQENPIIFIRPNCQILDFSRLSSQMMEKAPFTFYTSDLLQLIEVYNGRSNKSFNFHKVGFQTNSNVQTILESSEVVSLKLVNAIEPTELQWQKQDIDLWKLPHFYAKLAKVRLTSLVVITTMGGYVMAPTPFYLDTFLLISIGTFFTSASANCINQFFEVPFDSQMKRTKNRVLVRGLLTPLHVFTFATICGVSGLTILTIGANGLTAALGGLTLALYTIVYTPSKRLSIFNTWIGSFVGAIPPVMGWVASTGQIDLGAVILGAILFAWQFPHFNSLSWNLRADYALAGYQMMSVTSPDLCRITTLRYSIILLLLCNSAPLLDITTWTFAIDSLPVNLCFIYLSWQFYKKSNSQTARKLFHASLLYLPVIMTLLAISRKPHNKTQIE